MEKHYKWHEGSRYSGRVSVVGQELEKLRRRNNGIASPKAVVRSAKNKKSPLHRYFEWDDTAAAEKWRLEEARNLVQSVEVVFGDNPKGKPTRAYVSIIKGGERGYMDISDVMTDPELREQLLAQALSEADSYRSKYKTLTELQAIFTAIDTAKAKVKKRKKAA